MIEIEICNMRYQKIINPYDIRVDRKSKLGNPFYLKDENHRKEVCDKYEIRLKDKLKSDKIIIEEMNKLYQVYLNIINLGYFVGVPL